MNEEYLAILQSLKEEFKEQEDDYKLDTILVQEKSGPKLSENSKSFRESSKVIFKQEISKENAILLGNEVLDTKGYSIENLSEYKSKINNRCGIITAVGESPVEMLVYASKGLVENSIFSNAIRDILKNIYTSDKKLIIDGYKSILSNWRWSECIDLVLSSIKELRINEINEYIFKVVECNKQNRNIACKTLFFIEATEYYDSIFNFLTSQENESREEIEIFRELVIYFSTLNDKNTSIIYKNLMILNIKPELTNIMIAGIRRNFSENILSHIENTLINPEVESYTQYKLIKLLGRCAKNKKVIELLYKLRDYSHLNQSMIENAIGDTDINLQIEIAKDKNKPERSRANAIIHLGRIKKGSHPRDKEIDSILSEISKESDWLRVAASSAMVERGAKKEIVTLFSEIVKRDDVDEIAKETVNQIRRLRGTNDGGLNDDLLIVASQLLGNDDLNCKNRVIKILDLFTTGLPSDKIGVMFLNKLTNTHHGLIKVKILNYYAKNFNKFDLRLRSEIKKAIVRCTKENGIEKEAMRCLKIINSFVDDTPIIREV